MIVIFTFLIGIALLWAGKIETLTLNKTLDMIELRKTNMMCRNKVEVRDISKIFSNTRIVAAVKVSVQESVIKKVV